jgi:hypothetical protein
MEPNPKETPAYLRAKAMLPAGLHAAFDELLGDYKFAALKHLLSTGTSCENSGGPGR